MKWGRITFATSLCYKNFCNIGDVMQTFAVDLIYKEMQIDSEQIIDIPADEISTYNLWKPFFFQWLVISNTAENIPYFQLPKILFQYF